MPYNVETLVVGCGNILYKDDGFGSTVIEELKKYFQENSLPDKTEIVDGGTGASYHIFTFPETCWKKVIVVDAIDFGGEPGEIRILKPEETPLGRYENPHARPGEHLLSELEKECEVKIIGCQPKDVPIIDIDMGLTTEIEEAIPEAINIILKEIGAL
ncbi:MAG: coenzyme F420-reducing hydrogenase, FrhD protein [Methanobrevibacter sp.]|uniref:coenzyme F420-reducing hydrogenase, FrhD protein n=1 Tax=Methanobrevibacter sp. TaxID=66852 RepID=UPI0026DF1823|nr:coenzyme F420-reducing hydrogenase, FrhD protein [Methanobrevibacter sp.]MDO5848673.1 coenzyme F420-reducing hydrogenase, FrhD protein [Methanobrevibacter sp.]